MGLADAKVTRPGYGDVIPAQGMTEDEFFLLTNNGWKLNDAGALTTDPWSYRSYIIASRGEFSVARDQNVRLRSGWFSERSACYLAAGRPVITQDTGFGTALPTGEGLFPFNSLEEIIAAFEAIQSDYCKHSRAARAIAHEYFRAEIVLAKVLKIWVFDLMPQTKCLIVNADDFGRSNGINLGIIEAFEKGHRHQRQSDGALAERGSSCPLCKKSPQPQRRPSRRSRGLDLPSRSMGLPL